MADLFASLPPPSHPQSCAPPEDQEFMRSLREGITYDPRTGKIELSDAVMEDLRDWVFPRPLAQPATPALLDRIDRWIWIAVCAWSAASLFLSPLCGWLITLISGTDATLPTTLDSDTVFMVLLIASCKILRFIP